MKQAERDHPTRVAALGCIVCRQMGHGETPAEPHHIRSGHGIAQRADNFSVIPLCHQHHWNGGHGVATHTGRETREQIFGAEIELLQQTNLELGVSA